MKKIPICMFLCAVVPLGGCIAYRPKVNFSAPSDFVLNLNKHFTVEQAKYLCYRDGKDYTPDAVGGVACGGPIADGPARAKLVRDEMLDGALPFIDDAYERFIEDMEKHRSRNDFLADVVELSTSAAIGFTNGQRPIKIMGIALTGFRGARRSGELNFFKEQTVPILINKMDDNRAKVHQSILEKKALSIDRYSMGDAITDVVAYYNAGTLIRAFAELSKETAAQAKDSQQKLQQFQGPVPKLATKDQITNAENARSARQIFATSLPADRDKTVKTLQAIIASLQKDDNAKALLSATPTCQDLDDNATEINSCLTNILQAAIASPDLQDKINTAINDQSADISLLRSARTANKILNKLEASLGDAAQRDLVTKKLQQMVKALDSKAETKPLLNGVTPDEPDGKKLLTALRGAFDADKSTQRYDIARVIIDNDK